MKITKKSETLSFDLYIELSYNFGKRYFILDCKSAAYYLLILKQMIEVTHLHQILYKYISF